MPDGQVYSTLKVPSGFDPASVSAAVDAAYGVPTAPPSSSPAYSAWLNSVKQWANPVARPYLVVTDSPISQPNSPTGALSPTAALAPNTYEPPGPYWAGYGQSGSGWTEAEAVYAEPYLGHTACTDPGVVFWAGIGGVGSQYLGQDGTSSGSSGLHRVFTEVTPAGEAIHDTTVPAGVTVRANVQYNGGGSYAFDVNVGGVNHSYSGSGGYSGNWVEEITERPQVGSGHLPLLNFQSVTMTGYNGRSLQPLPSNANQWNMTGFATTGGISGGTFTVTDQSCGG